MPRLHISAISYLNTAPLMWDFQHGRVGDDFHISYTVPSRCAEQLRSGTADIGIIPAVTYAVIPELIILPDVAIAARGPVRSIALVSRQPLDRVSTVAVDTSSRTSVALLRVLFRKWLGGDRELREMQPELDLMLNACDAALLIGDPALKVDRTRYLVCDLAEEWHRRTGKPFVFAFWAVRMRALDELRAGLDLAAVFRESRDHGLEPQNVASIARQWSPRLGLSEADITSYLTQNIYYSLDQQCLNGMDLFFQSLVECGFLREPPMMRFMGTMSLAFRS